MLPNQLEDLLTRIEEHFEAMSRSLVAGDAPAMEQASAVLRLEAVEFGRALQNGRPLEMSEGTRLRLSRVAAGLASQREGLLRHAAVVDQSLGSLVPATRRATYAAGSGPFGNNTRQSGAFRLLSA